MNALILWSRLATIICVVAVANSAAALEANRLEQGSRTVLLLSGEFTTADPEKVRRHLRGGDIDEIHFNSDGGNLFSGLSIGNILRDQNMEVRVLGGADCASACAYAFLGGRIRHVDPGGRIGVHMATLAGDDEFREKVAKFIRSGDETKLFVAISRVEQMAAYAASNIASYLVRMGISLKLMTPNINTDNWEVYWLSRSELRRFNIVNTE